MSSTAVLILLGLPTLTIGYLATCALFPYRACPHCHGDGTRTNPLGRRTFRMCRRCDGTGRQVRPGRRLYEHLTGKPRLDRHGRTR